METIFDPKYVGILPVVDYIFEGSETDINSFRCTIDIMQMEQKKTDVKIGINKGILNESYILSGCSLYLHICLSRQ